VADAEPVERSRYGGRKDMRMKPLGHFYTAQVEGRHWLVDPEGYLFLAVGMNQVRPDYRVHEKMGEHLKEMFGTEQGWREAVMTQLKSAGFNLVTHWPGPLQIIRKHLDQPKDSPE